MPVGFESLPRWLYTTRLCIQTPSMSLRAPRPNRFIVRDFYACTDATVKAQPSVSGGFFRHVSVRGGVRIRRLYRPCVQRPTQLWGRTDVVPMAVTAGDFRHLSTLSCADRVLPHGVGFAVTAKPNGLPHNPQQARTNCHCGPEGRRGRRTAQLSSAGLRSPSVILAKLQVAFAASRGFHCCSAFAQVI